MFFFSNISPLTFWDIWDRSFAPPAYAWTCPYSGYRQSSPGETDSLASSDVVHVQKWHVSRIFNEKTVDPPILIRKNVFSSKLLPGGLLPSRIYQIVLDDLQSRSWIIWGSGFGVIAQTFWVHHRPGWTKSLGIIRLGFIGLMLPMPCSRETMGMMLRLEMPRAASNSSFE